MSGGMAPSTPALLPGAPGAQTVLSQLRAMGVPGTIAVEAARLHPVDINAALDWACSSERRHTRLACGSPVDLTVTSPVSPARTETLSPHSPPRPRSYVNLLHNGHCMLFEVQVPTTGAELHNLFATSLFSAAAGRPTLQLTHVESGRVVANAPEHFPISSSDTLLAQVVSTVLEGQDAAADIVRSVPESASYACATASHEPAPAAVAPATTRLRAAVPPVPGSWCAAPVPRPLGAPCFRMDPVAEVHHWFCVLANSDGEAVRDMAVWQQIPLYSQYIREHTLQEVYQHSLESVRSQRGLEITVEQASKLPRVLGYTTLLPLAVASEYLHLGCGLPAIFAFDLFQACLASCQNKSLSIALWADDSSKHTTKARWWACPTGDPNAGKSPTCTFVMDAFAEFVNRRPRGLYSQQHWIGVGNNNRIQNRLRALDGALLLQGPESKPILDPAFPTKKTVDTGKFLDLTRWLEAANGGRFEWGTGEEEKRLQARRSQAQPAQPPPTHEKACLQPHEHKPVLVPTVFLV